MHTTPYRTQQVERTYSDKKLEAEKYSIMGERCADTWIPYHGGRRSSRFFSVYIETESAPSLPLNQTLSSEHCSTCKKATKCDRSQEEEATLGSSSTWAPYYGSRRTLGRHEKLGKGSNEVKRLFGKDNMSRAFERRSFAEQSSTNINSLVHSENQLKRCNSLPLVKPPKTRRPFAIKHLNRSSNEMDSSISSLGIDNAAFVPDEDILLRNHYTQTKNHEKSVDNSIHEGGTYREIGFRCGVFEYPLKR